MCGHLQYIVHNVGWYIPYQHTEEIDVDILTRVNVLESVLRNVTGKSSNLTCWLR